MLNDIAGPTFFFSWLNTSSHSAPTLQNITSHLKLTLSFWAFISLHLYETFSQGTSSSNLSELVSPFILFMAYFSASFLYGCSMASPANRELRPWTRIIRSFHHSSFLGAAIGSWPFVYPYGVISFMGLRTCGPRILMRSMQGRRSGWKTTFSKRSRSALDPWCEKIFPGATSLKSCSITC